MKNNISVLLLSVLFTLSPLSAFASTEVYSCDINTLNGTTTCVDGNGYVSFVSPITKKNINTSNEQNPVYQDVYSAVVKITLPDHANAIKIDTKFAAQCSGWKFHIGDSATNDGWGGDGSTQSNDSEVQVTGSGPSVYGSDVIDTMLQKPQLNVGNGRELMYWPNTPLCGSVNHFILSDQKFEYDWGIGSSGIGSVTGPYMFALNNEMDTQGTINKDIYLGLNRTIGNATRHGFGLNNVKISFIYDNAYIPQIHPYATISKPIFNETNTNISVGCFPGAKYSALSGLPCNTIVQTEPVAVESGCNGSNKYSATTGLLCSSFSDVKSDNNLPVINKVNIPPVVYYRQTNKSVGSPVRRLQQILKDQGYLGVKPTGYYGPMTRNALLAFINENNVLDNNDGKLVDSIIWQALLELENSN